MVIRLISFTGSGCVTVKNRTKTTQQIEDEGLIRQRMAEEERIQQRVDENGTVWTKVYFGGGAHFRNWSIQFVELKGEENVKVEQVYSTGLRCYEESGEKMYRVWVKNTDIERGNRR